MQKMSSYTKDPLAMPGYGYDQESQNGDLPSQEKINYQEPRKPLNRTTVLCAILAVISCLVSITTTGILFSTGFGDNEGHGKEPQSYFEDHPICVPCHHLFENSIASSHLMDQLQKREKDGIEECCVQNTAGMTALLNLAIRKQESQPVDQGTLNSGQVAAHKQLLPPQTVQTETRPLFFTDTHALKFSQEVTAIELDHDLTVEEDALVIRHSGIYYVYASLRFKPSSSQPGRDNKFQGTIYRQSYSKPDESGDLFKITHTVCQDCGEDETTSYSAGTFKLLRGDRIQIRTSRWNMLEFQPESCYAGLVMIGSS